MPVLIACLTQNSFITGNIPGKAASTKLTCVLGSAPNLVAEVENNLDSDKMAAPQMVDIRQLNPQQLTEVSQRMDQELAVLQGKYLLEFRYFHG